MSKTRPLFLIVLVTLLVFKTLGLNTFAGGTNDDVPVIYCSSSGVVAIGALLAGIGFFLLPTLPKDEGNLKPDIATFFGTIKIITDERIDKSPNVDRIKDYFDINIIDVATQNYHTNKNGRFVIGTINKTSKFEVSYLSEAIANSQFYAWVDDGENMQEIKNLALQFPDSKDSKKPCLVNMKLQRIDHSQTNQFKPSEVDVVLALELEDADQVVISSGFRCCAENDQSTPLCGTIRIIQDSTKMSGFREIIQNSKITCKKPKFHFNGHGLPTLIGKRGTGREDLFLYSEKGSKGFLSYGPYLSLPKGNYHVQINVGMHQLNDNLGFWDIYVVRLSKLIKQGDISQSNIETDFEVTDELEGEAFEIHTVSNGNGVIGLTSIIIEQI